MCEVKRIVYLVGAGMGTPGGMTQEAKEALEGCNCILGAKRLTAPFEEGSAPCHALYEPEKIRAYLDGHPEVIKAGIVLSGDTGFYSGAKKLEEALSDGYEIRRIPGISSVVYLAAALHVSWEDAALVSLHGRPFTTAHIAGNIKRLLYFYALIFYKSSNLPALLFCLDNEI